MPVFKFICKDHGEFTKMINRGENRAQCPKCMAWCGNAPAIPQFAPEVKEPEPQGRVEDARPITMSADELDRRIAVDSERAWEGAKERIQKAKEADEQASPEVKETKEENVKLRKQVQEVMLSEPPERLEQGGLQIWRRSEDHARYLGEKYPEAKVEKVEDTST